MQHIYCRGEKHLCSCILLSQPLSRRQNPLFSISVLDGLAKPTEKRLTCNLLNASVVAPCCALSPACAVDICLLRAVVYWHWGINSPFQKWEIEWSCYFSSWDHLPIGSPIALLMQDPNTDKFAFTEEFSSYALCASY